MKTIYKYPLEQSGMFCFIKNIYKDAVPIYVGIAKKQICIWFQVNTDNDKEDRKIHIRGTGQAFTGEEGAYIGTVIMPSNKVWHYYDDAPVWIDPPWMFTESETVELGNWEKEILEDPNKTVFSETTFSLSEN